MSARQLTSAEQFGMRQLRDCGAVAMNLGQDYLAKFGVLIDLGFARSLAIGPGRVLIQATDDLRNFLPEVRS